MVQRNRLRRSVGVFLGSLLGAVTGVYACTLQLDGAIACGDGYTDQAAGEQCDPRDEDSFLDACALTSREYGVGACDPITCELINDRVQCASCGDGHIDNDEQCDGDNLGGKRCPSAEDAVQCTSECKWDFSRCDRCGDEVVDFDAGEECDKANVGGLLVQRPCAGANLGEPGEVLPLASPNPNLPYTFGDAISCTNECLLSRLGCSYCNNGRRDPPTPLDEQGNLTLQEVCDGDIVDLDDMLVQFPNSNCWDAPQLRPNVGCDEDCLGYVTRPDQPACCVQSGANCPSAGSTRCCYEYAHPDSEPCELFIDAMDQQLLVCK